MKIIISINGSDGAGKTTQISLLKKEMSEVVDCYYGLDNYQPFNTIDDDNWWFDNSNPNEFCDIMYQSISERDKDILKSKKPIILVDKGLKTFDARIKATLIVKGLSDDESRTLMEKYKEKWNIRDISQYDLYLSLGDNFETSNNIVNERRKNDCYSEETQRIYKKYQLLQNRYLLENVKNSEFLMVNALENKEKVTSSIRNIVYRILRQNISSENPQNTIVAIGGMSESGKSTVGSIFQKNGIPNFKFKYIVRNIVEKYAIHGDLFDCDLKIVALLMMDEILKMMNDMYYWDIVSFESLHSLKLTSIMKEEFPDLYKVLFVKTKDLNRISRNSESLSVSFNESKSKIEKKDTAKKNKGADEIQKIADYIINNDNSLEELYNKIYNVIIDIKEKKKNMRNRAGGLLISNGKLLLMHRIKEVDGKIREYYVVPGGGIESGETIEIATIREMREETGLDVILLDKKPSYEFRSEDGIQYFSLVQQVGGTIGTGDGPEFSSPDYANRGKYSVEFVDLKDIINGKINLVPESIKEELISDLTMSKDLKNLTSADLVKTTLSKPKINIK